MLFLVTMVKKKNSENLLFRTQFKIFLLHEKAKLQDWVVKAWQPAIRNQQAFSGQNQFGCSTWHK